jgi:hypothetical protein
MKEFVEIAARDIVQLVGPFDLFALVSCCSAVPTRRSGRESNPEEPKDRTENKLAREFRIYLDLSSLSADFQMSM